ncbi:MAG TPA: PHP domain-containing protein [Candidatus Thermoplasmatota archaeon]|nr:PHP domain-containing protein [Candidatus Thermoplasmatota archaeon]
MEPSPAGAARVLDRFALVHRALGDRQRGLAYERAAASVRAEPDRLRAGATRADLERLPFVGPGISARLEEYLATGRVRALEALEAKLPRDFERFVEIPGIGPALALRIAAEGGVSTVEDLARAAESGRILRVAGVTERHRRAILAKLPALRAPPRRVALLAKASRIAERVVSDFDRSGAFARAVVAGEARRGRALVDRVAVIAAALDAVDARQALGEMGFVPVSEGLFRLDDDVPVEVRLANASDFGAALVESTGDEAHVAALAARAAARGLRLAGGRLARENGTEVPAPSEDAVYGLLGLATPPPELRESPAAFAWRGALVEEADIVGDLHVHTRASDGRATLPEMVEAAARRGRRWVAVSDHAAGLPVPRGLDEDALAARVAEVRGGAFPIPVLVGCEANILEDGSLGVDAAALEALDVVVGSAHSKLDQPRGAMTRRIVDALSTGLVDVLGHVTNRRLPARPESDFDVERVLDAVRSAGAALEINGSPERMDPPAPILRRARELGIPFALDSDAHAPGEFANVRWGVVAARRGGVPPGEVLTARPFDEVRRFLASRRRRAP